MLYLILSRTGGGKTTHIMNLMKDFSDGGNKITLIVPEQFSFMSEKIMLEKAGAKAMSSIEVESFTGIAEKIVGKPAFHERKRIDDPARAALMRLALESVKDKLKLYSEHIYRKSVITEFMMLSTEFKQSSVSADDIRDICSKMDDCLLKTKLTDISLVFDAYNGMIEAGYFDPDDLLTEMCEAFPENDHFNNRIVFFDSFRGFTNREYKVIEHIMRKAKAVYVTLCTDDLSGFDDETDLFAHTKRTAQKLIFTARNNNIPVAKPQYLSMGCKFNNFPPHIKRYSANELAALEQELFSPAPNAYEDNCDAITLCKAADIYCECEFVASTAKKLIRENGYRRSDIAIIAGNSADYETPMRTALKKCGISVFDDSRQPIEASPVVNLVDSALCIAANGFDTENVMRLLKTGLAGYETSEISELENYCYMWEINRGKWLTEWDMHPRGFGYETEQEDILTLERLNLMRKRISEPLCELKERMDGVNGEDAATALYSYLERIDARENLRAFAHRLAQSGETGLVIELERLWNAVMQVMDSLVAVTKERYVSAKSFYETAQLMLSVQTVGSLPQGLDEIIIGSADRIRTVAPKVVFIVGANDGVFPAIPSSGSALTDRDRRTMSEMGLELSDFGEYKLAEQRLIAYSALCCARDRLYVCCPERNAKGEQLGESELYIKIRTLFPKCRELDADKLDGLYYVEGNDIAFEQLAKNKRYSNDLYYSLRAYFASLDGYENRLAALERAADGREFRINDRKAAEKLFGRNIYISASRLEQYNKCAFSYFCKYGLKARPKIKAEMDQLQRGSLIHYILECIFVSNSSEELADMSRAQLKEKVDSIMKEFLDTRLSGAEKNARFMYLYEKLSLSVCDVAERIIKEFSLSSFRPVDFELQIGDDGGIPPYEVTAQDGSTVRITGAVDRVDTAEINGKTYFRVIDYKSSGKDFRLGDVLQGLNMQMLIYLFAIWKNGNGRYGDVTPAGVIYYPAKSPTLKAARGSDEQSIAEEKYKKCKMQGILLDDVLVIGAMDRSLGGLYLPAGIKNAQATGSVIGLEQLARLKEKADGIISEMAECLHNGNISAVPAYGKSYEKICEYCEYKAVCGYESDIPVREIKQFSSKEINEMLMKGDGCRGEC